MQITEFDVIPVAHREPPVLNSWGVHPAAQARTVVRIRTADGLEGVGETYGDATLIEELENASDDITGTNPYDREPIRQSLSREAYGAYETAVFDVIGKAVGEPVHRLLGGKLRNSVEFSAYLFYKYADPDPDAAAICPEEVRTPEAMVEQAKAFHRVHGFEEFKLKGGVFEPELELETLELMAAHFGADQPFRIDPNGAWTEATTIHADQRLAASEVNLQFLEDPVMDHTDRVSIAGELSHSYATNHIDTLEELAEEITDDCIDVVLSDHHYFGGLSYNQAVGEIAKFFDVGVGMHSTSHLGISMAAMVHSAATMPTLDYACDTHYPWQSDDVITDTFEFENGCLDVPDEPGLGVTIDEDELERLHQQYQQTEIIGSTEAMRQRDPDFVPNTEEKW